MVGGYAISIHFVSKYQQLLLISPQPPLIILMNPIKLYIFLILMDMGRFYWCLGVHRCLGIQVILDWSWIFTIENVNFPCSSWIYCKLTEFSWDYSEWVSIYIQFGTFWYKNHLSSSIMYGVMLNWIWEGEIIRRPYWWRHS